VVGVRVVEEFADGVPVAAASSAESFGLGVTYAADQDVADVAHRGGSAGRDGLGVDRVWKIGQNLFDVRLIEIFPGERREMASGILGFAGAVQGLVVRGTETIPLGRGGVSAVAAVGEGEAAEGEVWRVFSFA
jgi:hypothetical protein